jgi:glutathione synthase/RimK-type ligase-like ATP-grasp enzyme
MVPARFAAKGPQEKLSMQGFDPTIGIYYEHQEWFRPLFAELDRRGLPYEPIRADELIVDPEEGLTARWPLLLNRMSPSAWDRGRGGVIFETIAHLEQLEDAGVSVLNGTDAYRLDLSKTRQIALLKKLGLQVPRTRAVYGMEQLQRAASELTFPLLVKPNMGGNGAGIERFSTLGELQLAVELDILKTGPDGVLLLQEYHAPQGGRIVRAETLGGHLLYAVQIHLGPDCGFSLCPADLQQTVSGEPLGAAARASQEGNQARVEAFTPPLEVIAEIERIARAGHLDVGGIEYLESERDGGRYFYDVNALSNFVAEAEKVVGFDPTARLVDYLETRLEQAIPQQRRAA